MKDISAKKRATTASLVAIGVGSAMVLANSWHVLSQWFVNPQDRLFTGIAHYFADYFLYVSFIAQGMRGSFIQAVTQYTNEPLPPTWIYWPNVLLGRLGSFFSDSPFVIYNASLIILVILLLVLIHLLVRMIFPKQPVTQMIAFLFVTTASNAIDLVSLVRSGTLKLASNLWFSPTPALNRLGGVPHQVFQTILLLLVILWFSKYLEGPGNSPPRSPWLHGYMVTWLKNQKPFQVFSFIIHHSSLIILAALAATLAPTQMVLVGAAIVIMIATKGYLRITQFRRIGTIFLGLAAAAFGAFAVNRTFDASPMLVAAKQWEFSQVTSVKIGSFLIAMGPIMVFFPFGVVPFLKRPTSLRLLLFLYGIGSLIVFFSPLPAILVTSATRWIHPAGYIIFPIIAAEGLMGIAAFTHKITRKQTIANVTLSIFLLLYLVLTIPAIAAQVNARTLPLKTDPTLHALNHVPKPVVEALTFKGYSFKGQGVVLTDPVLPYDVLVPIVTGKTSFTGHPVYTLYPQTKEELRRRFFSTKMNETEAIQFMKDHNIRFILASSAASRALPTYPFMVQAFQNEVVTVYSTQM